jgi:hypothetical protein
MVEHEDEPNVTTVRKYERFVGRKRNQMKMNKQINK